MPAAATPSSSRRGVVPRLAAAVASTLVLGLVLLLGATAASAKPSLAEEEERFLSDTNASRAAGSKFAYPRDSGLDAYARSHSEKMRDNAGSREPGPYLQHSSTAELRAATDFGGTGCAYGENIGERYPNTGNATADAIHDQFMRSESHRPNIMGESHPYTAIGIGVAHGTYNGEEVMWVTEVFVQRCAPPAPATTRPPTTRRPVATTAVKAASVTTAAPTTTPTTAAPTTTAPPTTVAETTTTAPLDTIPSVLADSTTVAEQAAITTTSAEPDAAAAGSGRSLVVVAGAGAAAAAVSGGFGFLVLRRRNGGSDALPPS